MPPIAEATKRRVWFGFIDVFIIVVMGGLLFYGASWQIFKIHTDVSRYECYAVDFWQGVKALQRFPAEQCGFIVNPRVAFISTSQIVQFMVQYHFPSFLVNFVAVQNSSQPFHALPHEYPLPALIPFSLALFATPHWYQVVFAGWMALVAASIYLVLLRYRSRSAAIAFAFFLAAGGWGTAEGRFDLIPSALTLFAVLCAVRTRWNWAFALLALATVFKFYPLPLLIPFLLAQQMTSREKWNAWRRFLPLGSFIAVCVVVMGASLLLSVEGTIGPFSYFENRPFQAETVATSLLWLLSFLGYPVQPVYSYGSLNVVSPLSALMSIIMSVLLVGGLVYTYWLQWRGKIDVAASVLLTLLIVMLTGKVFSPQYMIWVAPLVAYVGQGNRKWIIAWGIVSVLTTVIYPYLYTAIFPIIAVPTFPAFYPTTTARNLLLFGFILCLLWYYAQQKPTSVIRSGATAK